MADDQLSKDAQIAQLKEAIRGLDDQYASVSVKGGVLTVTLDATFTDEEREAIEWFAEVRKPLDSLDGGEYVATLRKLLERTNHYAVPEAIARTGPSESSVPLGNGRGCGGTDPVTLPAMGTGNLSEAEIDALEFVVEEGRIACMDDYGILRSLLVRVRPEWGAASKPEPPPRRCYSCGCTVDNWFYRQFCRNCYDRGVR
jgi:hypothetical protein